MPQKRIRAQIVRVSRQSGTRHAGILSVGPLTMRCQLGRTGVTRLKREGDGATPAARMRLLSLLYRADRIGRPAGWYGAKAEAIEANDGWCDDPAHRCYNRLVSLPFAASHEVLSRGDHLYDVIGILDWNLRRRSLGRGSAIFLHLARPDGGPTEGCIALAPADMRRLLLHLRPGAEFRVA
jgi:L,D-peptidoglycan transpeptidase YkuD (ErfK/YbiS/YcfS/YnhG family)